MIWDGLAAASPWISVSIVGMLAGIWAFVNRKGGEKAKRHDMEPPTWADVYKEMRETKAEWAKQMADLKSDWEVRHAEQGRELREARDELSLLRTTSAIKDRAVTNILTAFIDQWPSGHPTPVLDTKDVEVVGDTMPHNMRLPRRIHHP